MRSCVAAAEAVALLPALSDGHVSLTAAVHHISDREAARRLGGLDLAHAKGHSKYALNGRADVLANLGKGAGPCSRQLVSNTAVHPDTDQRVEDGEGYPHQAAVPGAYARQLAQHRRLGGLLSS